MPDPSTHINGSGSTASTSVNSLGHEKFAGRWKKFEACFKDMLPFSKHISSLEDALDKQKMLESEISEYKTGQQQMIKGFAESDRKRDDKASQLLEDLDDANDKIKSLEGQVAALKRGSVSQELFNQRIQEMKHETSRKVT